LVIEAREKIRLGRGNLGQSGDLAVAQIKEKQCPALG